MSKNELKEYYIAYFDILGYKSFFDNNDNDALDYLWRVISVCHDTYQSNSYTNNQICNANITVKTFSDNFIVMSETCKDLPDHTMLNYFAQILSKLQLHFLEKYRILIRGGLTKGEAYVDNSLVFGTGLIRAVELEGKAVFPRIIVDQKCFDKITLNSICDSSWFAKDEDEEYYVEYFRDLFIAQDKKTIETIRKSVFQLTNKYGKYKRSLKDSQKLFEAEKTISKYAWLLCKYNKKCESIEAADPIIYTLKFYDRLMKVEIILL